MILMLEDNAERVQRFRAVLTRIAPATAFQVWRSARVMVRELVPYLPKAVLLSLDHDLDPLDGDTEDPGDGLDVVKFLAEQPPTCPVIVHSSNRERSDWMLGDLELAGWKFRRVAPLRDDWIEQSWRYVARRLLRKRQGHER